MFSRSVNITEIFTGNSKFLESFHIAPEIVRVHGKSCAPSIERLAMSRTLGQISNILLLFDSLTKYEKKHLQNFSRRASEEETEFLATLSKTIIRNLVPTAPQKYCLEAENSCSKLYVQNNSKVLVLSMLKKLNNAKIQAHFFRSHYNLYISPKRCLYFRFDKIAVILFRQ